MKPLVFLLALVTSALAAPVPIKPPAADGESTPLHYVIVVTGGELLEGVYPDAHTAFLTRTLRPLGCQCVGSMIVDDKREDIQQAVRFALNRAPLVIVTGGLGPTSNDVTREALSHLTGIELIENPDAMVDLERRMNQSREQLRSNLRRQTLIPARGSFLKNLNGTAVGLVFDSGRSVVIALPGPPRELQAMATDELVPLLQRRFGVREFGTSLTLRFVGTGQSLIDQTLRDDIRIAPDFVVTSLFEGGRVDFTFSLPGHSEADRDRLGRLKRDIEQHLGAFIYADDASSLEDVVVRNIAERGGSLVLLEMGSGGSIASALTGAAGGSTVIAGAYVTLTDIAMAGLLDVQREGLPTETLERLKALAMIAATKTGSNWAFATSPEVPGPEGARSIWVACKPPNSTWESQRLPMRGSGAAARAAMTTQIMDFLRKCSQKQL